jgi:hypothetical protein
MESNTTIVSAFLTNINKRNDRPIEKYIEYGKLFLSIRVPKIIFIEKHIFDEHYTCFAEDEYNFFVFTQMDHLMLHEYKDKITEFEVNGGNTNKDTIEYMFVQCNKTEWVRWSIEFNRFKSDQFIWIDFGIAHMINDYNLMSSAITDLCNKKYSKVRIAGCWNIETPYRFNIYKDIVWYFAGSVFGGDKNNLLEFADKMHKKCLEIIQVNKHIMWEINIWYILYFENKHLFDIYKADHNLSIITNY